LDKSKILAKQKEINKVTRVEKDEELSKYIDLYASSMLNIFITTSRLADNNS
jgi:hypothetical protein